MLREAVQVILAMWMQEAALLFAWHKEQRSLVKFAQVVHDTASSLMEALGGT
jgi:hypothetical protein